MSGTPTYITTQVAAFEDAVIELLRQQPELAGVQVAVGPLGDDSAREYIQSLGASSTQEWSTMGNLRKRENLELVLEVYAEAPSAGEDVIRAARDRAMELTAAIDRALRQGVSVPGSDPIRQVELSSIDAPLRTAGAHRTSRAEVRHVRITGYADLRRQ